MDGPFEKLLSDARIQLLARLAGERSVGVWLVGGCLRDALMGRDVRDYDFALEGAEEELPGEFASRIGGCFFWLDRMRRQSRVVQGKGDESFTFDFAPVRGGDILADLSLRDFTINSMAFPVSRPGTLLDPLGGRHDILSGTVRACSGNTFEDDPLRLVRAVRFAAALKFRIEENTKCDILRKSSLLENVARERIRDEVFQILATPGIGDSLETLRVTGLLARVLPLAGETAESIRCRIVRTSRVEALMDSLERNFPRDWHPFSRHLQRLIEGGVPLLSLVKLASFLFGEAARHPAEATCEMLRLGNRAGAELKTLLDSVSRIPAIHAGWMNDRVLYRFFRDLAPAGPELSLLPLSEGLVTPEQAERLVSYYFHDYHPSDRDLFLTGGQVMELLGIGQGPELGSYMELLREAESLGRVSTEAEAREFLLKNRLTRQGLVG